jgi:hypothetical protein
MQSGRSRIIRFRCRRDVSVENGDEVLDIVIRVNAVRELENQAGKQYVVDPGFSAYTAQVLVSLMIEPSIQSRLSASN